MTAPEQQRHPAAQRVIDAARAETERLVEEYMFMRSFGSGHEWACQRMGITPTTLQRRLERNGYGHLI